MNNKLYFLIIFFFASGCIPQSQQPTTSEQFLSIEPWTKRQEVIERFGQPFKIHNIEGECGEVEHLEYVLDFPNSYSGGIIWGTCTVVIHKGVAVRVIFSDSQERTPLKAGVSDRPEQLTVDPSEVKLSVHLVVANSGENTLTMHYENYEEQNILHLRKQAIIDQHDIQDMHLMETGDGIYSLTVMLTPSGTKVFHDFTKEHVGERAALVIDGEVRSAPQIIEPISQGSLTVGRLQEQFIEELLKKPLSTINNDQ